MNKLLLTVLLVALPVNSFAAQQQLQTRSNTTSPSVDTNFTRQQAMNTDLYTNKADKASAIIEWSAWPDGTQFIVNAIVSYQGSLYKCLQTYTKNSGDTPAAFTSYWAEAGGATSYNALTDKPTIPASLADLSADATHRVVTDAEKTTWNGKESSLGVPATSDWCLKSDTSGVRAWGACGSMIYPSAGNIAYTANGSAWAALGLVTTVGATGTDGNVPTEQAVREAITTAVGTGPELSVSAPLDLNELTGVLSITANAYQAYDANMITWPVGVTATEIGYIDFTSSGQTQLNAKRSIADERKEIGWLIKDSDVVTEVADGKQAAVIPANMAGMLLVDLTCSVSDLNSAASRDTTVVLRRVRDATAVDMTSTGVTIAYTDYTASDETVDTANDDVATGDKIFVDVNAVTSPAQKGLGCTAVFANP